MTLFVVRPVSCLRGEVRLSGDKSIAHRSLILSALAQGPTVITNFPLNQDCLATIRVFRSLGVKIDIIEVDPSHKRLATVCVAGKGLFGLRMPKAGINAGESGTTFRLISGVLAGQGFTSRLLAAPALCRRPMLRVTHPLRLMGAEIKPKDKSQKKKDEEYPPLTITGKPLRGITYKVPMSSAQVKSAILLAGLYAKGKTRVIETFSTRDHTERMLKLFNARIKVFRNIIVIEGGHELKSPGRIYVPGDISSASFFMVVGSLLAGSRVRIKDVSLNPSRTGVIRVLKRMGADIEAKSQKSLPAGREDKSVEPQGDILINSSRLRGVRVKKEEIPSLIDELPVLMVAAALAQGESVFEAIGELRVKETDRIRSMIANLTLMGANISLVKAPGAENVRIQGVARLKGAQVRSFADHRTAMSLVIAGLCAQGLTRIDDVSCINKSFPDFLEVLARLKA
jgi:3-phosphoshikimate 1-carboxyvinyltransferase